MEEDKRVFQHLFRFEDVWARDVKCTTIVRQKWVAGPYGGINIIKYMAEIEEEFKEFRSGVLERKSRGLRSFLKRTPNRGVMRKTLKLLRLLSIKKTYLK